MLCYQVVCGLWCGLWSEGAGAGPLEQMVIRYDGELVHVQAKGPTPSVGVVLPSVMVGPYQLGLKSVDGSVTVFVFDFEKTKQTNVESSYMFLDGVVSFRFSRATVSRITLQDEWVGTLSVDGIDLDSTGAVRLGDATG